LLQVGTVLHVTVVGKGSPCLYLNSWALLSDFLPLSCWGGGSEIILVWVWQLAKVSPPHLCNEN